MKTRNSRREGLILLIVLGMLSLFSLLAISFMVITSQSRRSNAGRANRDFRGTAPEKLLDSAMRVALRGTTDGSSFLRGQGLLADLHGVAEAPIRVRVRSTIWGVSSNSLPPNQAQAYSNPITHNAAERPLLLGNRFLRIPVVSSGRAAVAEVPRDDIDFPSTGNPNPITNPQFDLPLEHDAWTSRIATFLSGPLQGESFRIVRYIGYEPTTDGTAPSLQQSYSITIDLQDASRRLATIGSNTRSIEEWAIQTPPGGGAAKRGLFLCYGNVPNAGNVRLAGGYEILINAIPLNSHGIGINGNFNNSGGVSAPDPIAPIGSPLDNALASVDANLRSMPAALQPNRNAPNTPPLSAVGDADEDYDAADFQNWYLSHRYAGTTNSAGIIPSFHRAALINYIVNAKDPRTYENGELYAAVTRILRAAGRPLSVRAIDRSASNPVTGGPLEVFTNPDFTGSNGGQFTLNDERSTQLDCVWESLTNWQDPNNPRGVTAFLDWVRWLTKGPWDVDSDGDGVYDAIWTDPNLPLTTSREGKLLKVLVSYQIESLDSRLDLNAAGNLTQTVAPAAYGQLTNDSYAVGRDVQLAQGVGRGPAEVSLRHLFGASGANNYRTFLESRYQGQMPNGSGVLVGETLPGVIGNDVRSQLDQREIRPASLHSLLPALPADSGGRISLGLDRMGNPLMVNAGPFTLPPFAGRPAVTLNDIFNDHYETSLLSGGHGDNLFTIAEWERMLRPNDWDRSTLPRRLNQVFDAPRAVTPRSRHLRYTPAGVSRNTVQQSHSMYELVRDMFAFNPPEDVDGTAFTTPLSFNAYRELFPLEFHQGQGLNINRPLGNGVDDDADGNIDETDEALRDGIDNDGDGDIDELDERIWSAFQQRTYTSIAGNAPVAIALAESPIPGKIILGGIPYDRGIFDGNLDPTFEALANAALSGGAADSDNDGQADVDTLRYHFGTQSRQLLARNLYSLAMLILPDDLYLSNVPNTSPVTGHERARRIAQWAVNVVDFRDADSAMTRFPYDPDPFTPDPTTGAYWLPNPAAGHVVWGMEQPDAVLTESLATHDLRVDDTTDDSTGNDLAGGDPHKDQVRMPEGSAFLEVLALRTTSAAADTSTPGVSNSLYSLNGTNRELNLSSLSPPIDITPSGGGAAVTTRYPVFRVAISEPHPDPVDMETPLAIQDPTNVESTSGRIKRPIRTYQQSEFPNQSGLVWDTSNVGNTPLAATADSPHEIDRVLIFAPWSSDIGIPGLPSGMSSAAIAGRVYSNYNAGGTDVTLQGGEYLVVGPREITYFGSRSGGGHSHQPNPHRIALSDSDGGSTPAVVADWATVYGTDPTTTTTNQRVDKRAPTRLVKSMIAGQPAPWAEAVPMQSYLRPNYIGFNVSAPYANSYYRPPTDQLDSTDMGPDSVTGAPGFGAANMPADAYYDYGTLGGTVGTSVPDEPFDGRSGRPLSSSPPNGNEQWPYQDGMSMQPEPGTVQNWCTAYLQRLADPDRPWHRDLNPYITLDWIPIDLTVFSGEDDFTMPAGREYQFATRQKTGSMALTAGGYQPLTAMDTLRTFLSYDTTELADSIPVASSNAHFDVELPMDWATGGAPTTARPTLNGTTPNHVATLGYLNSTFRLSGESGGTSVAGFLGAPSEAPAALFWLDRQYTNPHEMAWAPLSAPGQLMQEFSAPATSTTTGAYADAQAPNDYTHLPNFFRAVPTQTGAATVNQLAAATLFDLVETPSPWIDAQEFVPPADIAFTASPGNVMQQAVNYIFEPLRAPYNRLSRFTEPGRVNINDISEPAVWQGIMWNAIPPAARSQIAANPTFWNELQISRAGYTPGSAPGVLGLTANPFLDANSPSQFGGVFKSSFAAGMVPATRNMQALDGIARDASGQLERPVNVTLMRSDTSSAALFRPDYSTFSLAAKQPLMDYLPFTRLSNLVTTRSNVFSVRVTIGMFEFNSATGLGREYGLDDGTAQRHSAYYVIDRSIPVGYQEGLDLNTDNCVLMRRVIE